LTPNEAVRHRNSGALVIAVQDKFWSFAELQAAHHQGRVGGITFVHGIGSNASKHRLLKGMIELSHALDLSVIAEGAETEDEVAVLRGMGAEQVQGYVYSRRVTAAEIPATVRAIKASLRKRVHLPPISKPDRRPA
jgi:predicted signal transduction protein with EAL and GGDEF domain